jgi:beta-glucosidase
MKVKVLIIFCFLFVGLSARGQQSYPFRNTTLTLDKRVSDLVSRLTLEEKVGQMMNDAPAIPRLGIPAYNWWSECLHGVARTKYHTTVYPQAIGMAASWDKPLLLKVASSIGDEARAIFNDAHHKGNTSIYHGLTYWSPNINIFRDPRWGRGQETYGEDPYLTGKMGSAFVRGLQGDNPRYLKASACAKHFAVHSGPELMRHTIDPDISTYDLWDTYLSAFRDLIVDAKVSGVMCAYNAFHKQPCCGSDILMQTILRNKWHFTGYVTSDCGAIEDFYNYHKTHPNATSAAIDAVYHGTDVECGDEAYKSLVKAVKDGIVKEALLDKSLKRLFTIRFRLGLFDPETSVPYSKISLNTLECSSHQELAKQMSRESIVLLKNENGFLPLDKSKLKKIVIIGPNIDKARVLLGNYNGKPSSMSSPLQAICSRLDSRTQVTCLKGMDYVDALNPDTLSQWMKQIEGNDLVVFIGGISPALEGEEMAVDKKGFKGGDRTSILLPSAQTEVMQALYAKGIPVVFVMLTGSAIAIPWEASHLPAILNAWYGGQYGGEAIADVLFGDYNPSGRLPVTFYEKDSDLPDFSSYSMEGRTYRYFHGKSLYPFGYGLSYTNFKYSNLVLPTTYTIGKGNLNLSVTVTNSGKVDGDEVAQLYISHSNKKMIVPITALKGFQRLHLKAGESKCIKFNLTAKEMSCINEKGESVISPETLTIYIGGSSPTQTLATPLPYVRGSVSMIGRAINYKQ